MLSTGFTGRFNKFKIQSDLPWSHNAQLEYNSLQKLNTAIRKEIEGKLRKLCMGGVPWSVEIQLLWDTIELWVMVVRRKSHVTISLKRIRRFLRRVPSVQNVFSCTLSEALHFRNSAYKAVSKAEAITKRHSFQGTLAKAIALKTTLMWN